MNESAETVKVTDCSNTVDKQAARSPASGRRQKSEFAAALLAFESQVRGIRAEKELHSHLCNTSRRVLPFRQAFLFRCYRNSSRLQILAASSLPALDRNAPFVRWVEKIVNRLSEDITTEQQMHFTLPAYCDETDEEKDTYPFHEFLWTPLIDDGQRVGGLLLARETPWHESDRALAERIADLYTHAWAAIKGRNRLGKKRIVTGTRALLCGLSLVMLGFLPVSISALAPAEVVPKDPFIVAAPFDGVVREILTEQGSIVGTGESVVSFDDIHLKNERKLAAQREAVAQARLQRATQSAIADHQAKRELDVARAEHDLAQAESAYAQDLLEKSQLKAPRSGVAIFTDKRDWVGRPVSAGESILSIADPGSVRFSIDLPVKESIVLNAGARVKVFLDSDPLNPLEASVTDASYQAKPDQRDILVYTVSAAIAGDQPLPRIGVQGTAQVYSGKASLAYVIFRRPLAALRQFTGW